jgi:hypothetical protein
MGELDVLTEVVIDRARPVVSRFVMDPENAPKWYANIRSVEWTSGPPLRPGARIAFVARFLGRRLSNRGTPRGFGRLVAPAGT